MIERGVCEGVETSWECKVDWEEVEIGVSRISYLWIFLKRIFGWPFFIFLFGFYEGTGLRG